MYIHKYDLHAKQTSSSNNMHGIKTIELYIACSKEVKVADAMFIDQPLALLSGFDQS